MLRDIKEKQEKILIDEKDKKILAILSRNSRETLVNVASELKMSVDAVRIRIKKLKENGFITGFTIIQSYKKLGYGLRAAILVKLKDLTNENLENFVNHLKKTKGVILLNAIAGDFDFEVVFIAKTSSDLARFSKEIRTKFSDIVVDWKVNLITESYKVEGFEI